MPLSLRTSPTLARWFPSRSTDRILLPRLDRVANEMQGRESLEVVDDLAPTTPRTARRRGRLRSSHLPPRLSPSSLLVCTEATQEAHRSASSPRLALPSLRLQSRRRPHLSGRSTLPPSSLKTHQDSCRHCTPPLVPRQIYLRYPRQLQPATERTLPLDRIQALPLPASPRHRRCPFALLAELGSTRSLLSRTTSLELGAHHRGPLATPHRGTSRLEEVRPLFRDERFFSVSVPRRAVECVRRPWQESMSRRAGTQTVLQRPLCPRLPPLQPLPAARSC